MSNHRGVIKLDLPLWEGIGCPYRADVRKRLLLPDDYVVEEVEENDNTVQIFVSGESIPDVEGVPIVTLAPYYVLVDGTPHLDHIEVVAQ